MALGRGSIAFVGFNSDGNDNLAFAVFEPIPLGTTIFFQDNEWDGTVFNTGESAWSWTATSDIAAGTVITIDNIGTGTIATNSGTVTFLDSSNRGIANSNEAVYAFLGTSHHADGFPGCGCQQYLRQCWRQSCRHWVDRRLDCARAGRHRPGRRYRCFHRQPQ